MNRSLFTIEDILAATGGKIQRRGPQGVFGVAVDSRKVEPGDLFLALRGARVDGHDYVAQALRRGAHWALVEPNRRLNLGDAQGGLTEVPDPWRALGDLAIYHRRRYPVPVVAVTGSIGKTCTKDLLASVLGQGFCVLYNRGNENSDIGLPLTLFRLQRHHQLAVLEMAMRGSGQISYLTHIAPPNIGVITNIDSTHMELLGSIEAIAQAKAELLDALPLDGTAVLNGDSPWVRKVAHRAPGTILWFGLEQGCDFTAKDIESHGEHGVYFTLVTPQGQRKIELPVPGRHMVCNALAAAAVGVTMGLNLDDIVQGLAVASVSGMRGQIHRSHELIILNDAYNAHPQSMLAALELLQELEGERKIAVLGSMLELGDDTCLAHRRVGQAVAAGKVDALITVGEEGATMVEAAVEAGLSRNSVCLCADNRQAQQCLRRWLKARDTVLVKGSRGLGMEEIVRWLQAGLWRGSCQCL